MFMRSSKRIGLIPVWGRRRLQVFEIRIPVIVFVLLMFPMGGTVWTVAGQQTDGPPAAARLSSLAVATDDNRYRIGPGDVITINVRKAPELSGTVRVDQHGMVRLPMIDGEVQAACQTEGELASHVTTLYREYKREPIVDVFVADFQSRPVAVIGAISSAGQFRLQRRVRLLELLSFAGGPSNKAGRLINVIHAGGPNICKNEAASNKNEEAANNKNETANNQPSELDDQLITYKLADTLAGKDSANPFVNPGDIISLPEADQVFIIGHVMSPQAIALRDKTITISRAIAMTGGPARDASTNRIHIIRQLHDGDKKIEIFVDLKAVLKQKAEDIALLPNDIVEVPSSTTKTIINTLQGAVAPALSQLPVRIIP